jgi:hypothetical protein
MFKVLVTSKQGKKRPRRQVSNDTFSTIQEARDFIKLSISRQEALCWRAWGLCDVQQQRDGLQVVVKYAPALVLLDSLVQTFTIKEAC